MFGWRCGRRGAARCARRGHNHSPAHEDVDRDDHQSPTRGLGVQLARPGTQSLRRQVDRGTTSAQEFGQLDAKLKPSLNVRYPISAAERCQSASVPGTAGRPSAPISVKARRRRRLESGHCNMQQVGMFAPPWQPLDTDLFDLVSRHSDIVAARGAPAPFGQPCSPT